FNGCCQQPLKTQTWAPFKKLAVAALSKLKIKALTKKPAIAQHSQITQASKRLRRTTRGLRLAPFPAMTTKAHQYRALFFADYTFPGLYLARPEIGQANQLGERAAQGGERPATAAHDQP
ncbi:MAG TPA: hypothetical protein VND64_12005, partial [Pirellulales bacterium]|nr:hypothetical protein [Pirellulales bacterium]